MGTFEEGVAVITGRGSGIRDAMNRRFTKAGMRIVVADVDLGAAKHAVPRITENLLVLTSRVLTGLAGLGRLSPCMPT